MIKEKYMEDKEIIELFFRRSEKAIKETARKYGAYLSRLAYGILYSREDAEECVNDTYMKAWDNIPPACPKYLSAFLGKITRNIALNRYDMLKAAKRGGGQVPLTLDELAECIPDSSDVQRQVESQELTSLLDRFLGKLSPANRNVFMKRYWYFLSIEEIAEETGSSSDKVKMRLFRTRKKLKEFLLKNGVEV